MDGNRFLRILWTINGLCLVIVFVLAGVLLVISLFDRLDVRNSDKVIVGKELEDAKAKGLVLQGLEFSEPSAILNSDGYLMPVSLETYETPRKDKAWGYDSDSRSKLRVENVYNIVNVIFFDHHYQVTGKLLDRKAFISTLKYLGPHDSRFAEPKFVQKNITYQVAFEDSNADGAINEDDDADLYISDLEGKNLTQVTSGLDVLTSTFIEPTKIFIKYQKRTKEKSEHKKTFFSIYDTESKTLSDLSSLHQTLDKIESEITK
jgi:hypothetical protein